MAVHDRDRRRVLSHMVVYAHIRDMDEYSLFGRSASYNRDRHGLGLPASQDLDLRKVALPTFLSV